MKKIVAIYFTLLGFTNMYAQQGTQVNQAAVNTEAPIVKDTNKVYTILPLMPKFQGDMNKYLGDSIKYPDDAKMNSIQGTVYIKFVIERDGMVSNVVVMRGIPGGTALDKEAVRVVKSMPKWTPGKLQNGQTARAQYMIPIHFMINEETPPPPPKPKNK